MLQIKTFQAETSRALDCMVNSWLSTHTDDTYNIIEFIHSLSGKDKMTLIIVYDVIDSDSSSD